MTTPRVPNDVGHRACISALLRAGHIEWVREGAKHTVMLNLRTGKTFTIPRHPSRPIRVGTMRNILRDAELTAAEFRDLL